MLLQKVFSHVDLLEVKYFGLQFTDNYNVDVSLHYNSTVCFSTTFGQLRLYWRRGVVVSGVRRMNEVNARRARLIPGWVTVFGRVYHLGM